MKKIGLIKNTVYAMAIVVILLVAILLVAGRFGIGGVRALVVQSGSMEPTILTKSVVIAAPSSSYSVGDIITFRHSGRENVLVTHRLQSIKNGNEFITKGDANEEADGESVLAVNVIGKVVFTIPFVGMIVSFAQTQLGFLLLVVIPAVAIVYSELLSIKKQIVKFLTARKVRKLIKPLR